MNIRPATEADESAIRTLWQEFEAEVPEPEGFAPDTWDVDWASLCENMRSGVVVVAEEDGDLIGFAEATAAEAQRWHLDTIHVRPESRRRGVGAALLRACVRAARARGARYLSLDALEQRLAPAPTGESQASIHVQSDDRLSVERALAQFVPRLETAAVRATANGWMRIGDRRLDHDGALQARLAAELSERLGAVVVALALERGAVVRFRLYERGRMVDEYLSVPTFYGELPKADELALAANPTLVARLTGADRDDVRRVARNATSPGELPPAPELYEQLARVLGLEP